uniref:Reverse transcriptase Ty1/copia-type domain-containing protein n=1 Tax=Cajanus cajan TaxID=3821 RepID=A0A151UB70_CAJCA|nr:hypothetical protein KK1_020824 [Cajanus cajan]
MTTRAKVGIFKPKTYVVAVHQECDHIVEPNSVKEVLSKLEWCSAMKEEFEALQKNATWDLVDLPTGCKPIDCRCVFRSKYNADGSFQIIILNSKLNSLFSLKDLGPLKYFLGIEVSNSTKDVILLSQIKYIIGLFHKAKMHESKPQTTPMVPGLKLSATRSSFVPDPTFYRSVVGGLQYISITRPELCYSINKVCQYMHNP